MTVAADWPGFAPVTPYHPGVVAKLPLDSPLWGRLSACYSAKNAVARLREVVAARELGKAWDGLREEILHQGSVYGVSSAAIPHLVDLAPSLPPRSRRRLWIETGFLVTAGADRFPSPPVAGLQEGLTVALAAAGALAVRDFVADSDSAPDDDCYFALACVALAGHPAGRAMWEFPSAGSGCVRVTCPGYGAESEVDGLGDPLALPCPVPRLLAAARGPGPWLEVAGAVERADRDQVLGPGWGRFFGTARRVALAGVPAQASRSAVWCLVAAMVSTRPASASWARTLARLTGHVRCLNCGRAWAIADAMHDGAGAEPTVIADARLPDGCVQDALFQVSQEDCAEDPGTGGVWPETVADRVAGFRPAPGRTLTRARLSARLLWSADEGAATALALVAGQNTAAVAAGGSAGVTLRHAASGAQAGPRLAAPARAIASVALPGGAAVIAAAGDDGSLRWRDAATGEPLDGTSGHGTAPALSLAPVMMPGRTGMIPQALAGLRGRTMLAVGDADGTVQLWDPVTRAPLSPLFRRPGRRVVSLTAVDFTNQPPWDGTDLIAVYGDLLVDVWESASVHGRLSAMAPDPAKLAAAGHQHVIAAAVSPRRLGYRRPVLLADRNGTVSMWETFGVRLADPLPPDPAHREVTAIAVLPGPGDGITVLTASHADSNLRAWQPLNGSAMLMPCNVRPCCLLTTSETLIIGHDHGLLALSLNDDPR